MILNHSELVDVDSDASAQGEADVLLGSLSIFGSTEDVLSGYKIQQE